VCLQPTNQVDREREVEAPAETNSKFGKSLTLPFPLGEQQKRFYLWFVVDEVTRLAAPDS
jgi:hypothetical protein